MKIRHLDRAKNIQHIVEGCIAKKPKYQRMLVNEFGDYLYAVCVRYMGDRQIAKDSLQDALLRILNNIEKHDSSRGKLKSWMTRITINVCLTELRKKKINKVDIDDPVIQIPDVSENALDKMSTDEIVELIEQLPEVYRQVFNMAVIDGYGHREIGETLGIEESSSRARLSRAKKMLRDMIIHRNDNSVWARMA